MNQLRDISQLLYQLALSFEKLSGLDVPFQTELDERVEKLRQRFDLIEKRIDEIESLTAYHNLGEYS